MVNLPVSSALQDIADALPGVARTDAMLAPYVGGGIGGPADLLVIAESRDVLVRAVHLAQTHGIPWCVYGGLTNVLIPDGGLRGMVVLNRARHVQFQDGYRVVADAGAIVVKVAREAIDLGWGGLTWAVGLPGTIGGAVVNNAGAFGGEISKVLAHADILTAAGSVGRVDADWFGFQYRYSKLKSAGQRAVVLGAEFHLRQGNFTDLAAKAAEYTERRRRTQPPGRTLGSTFKNPPGDYAGRMIEALGLKGTRCGGIKVSEHHANFLINDQHGTAADFCALVERVQSAVHAHFGVWLETEIEILRESELVRESELTLRPSSLQKTRDS